MRGGLHTTAASRVRSAAPWRTGRGAAQNGAGWAWEGLERGDAGAKGSSQAGRSACCTAPHGSPDNKSATHKVASGPCACCTPAPPAPQRTAHPVGAWGWPQGARVHPQEAAPAPQAGRRHRRKRAARLALFRRLLRAILALLALLASILRRCLLLLLVLLLLLLLLPLLGCGLHAVQGRVHGGDAPAGAGAGDAQHAVLHPAAHSRCRPATGKPGRQGCRFQHDTSAREQAASSTVQRCSTVHATTVTTIACITPQIHPPTCRRSFPPPRPAPLPCQTAGRPGPRA